MAPAWFPLRLFVCAVILPEWLGVTADPVTHLDCPSPFTNTLDNPITYTVDSVGITNAVCLAATTVVFSYARKGESSGIQVCSHPYPPASCADFTTSDTCGCKKQEGADYIYKYIFPANRDSQSGGNIKATLCVSPSGPFEDTSSNSCDDITFEVLSCEQDYVVGVAVTTLLITVTGLCLGFVYWLLKFFPFKLVRRNKGVVMLIVTMAVIVGIGWSVALGFGCNEYPEQDTCDEPCMMSIALTVVGVVVVISTVIFVVCKRLPATITSNRMGKLNDSYTLTWTVPDEDSPDIQQFSIEYAQVEVDQSREPWKPNKWLGVTAKIVADGTDRHITIPDLTANTFYGVKITFVKTGCSPKGPPFVFKTA